MRLADKPQSDGLLADSLRSPIEEAFSKIENVLGKLGASTHEALLEAMEEALCKGMPSETAGWFDHCGYEVEVQYL